MSFIRLSGAVAVALAAAAVATPATAATRITATLFSPAGITNPVVLDTGSTATFNAPIAGSGSGISYTVAFATAANQGVVQGSQASQYAVPVAGVRGGQPTYLTGNYGSAQTTDRAASGTYFSTGNGTITFTFSTALKAISLLWGSVDAANTITLSDGSVITGTAVQQAASGFISNGFQGAGGSAYVTINSDTGFTSFTASAPTNSFEFAGVVGSPNAIGVPEPTTWALLVLGFGLVGIGSRRRRATAVAA